VEKFSKIQTAQSIRLGQWMDWPNSYYTHTDSNIEGIWFFLKKCHENGWLYTDKRISLWCPRCGTSLSEHEMTGSYRTLEHHSIYCKLPIRDKNARILVWTTTPWTLPANVALAVKPEIDYCEATLPGESTPLILAQESLAILQDKKPKILRVFKGAELVGLRYETCFPDLPAQKGVEHRIVAWDEVDPSEGTGVVHIAPGCGEEDFELGQEQNLSIIAPVDEAGVYVVGFGGLSGKKAQGVAEPIIEMLENAGKLYKSQKYAHNYPICWRCKTETIFRPVDEWFINCTEIRPRLIEAARSVHWQPAHLGKRMEDWLANMGDWSISRKRFYGLPLPIYPCEKCGEVTVVGSKAELRQYSGPEVDELPELHRPWIDKIKIKCPSCNASVARIPEVGDVWLDAGIVPFSTLGYFRDRETWEKYYPAEWICEMREQVRLWFYSMLFMAVTLDNRSPYQRMLGHESVVAEDKTRFSKTGFMIHFDEAVEKIGADAMRYLFCSAPVAHNVRFGYKLGNEGRRRLLTFWNVYSFFITYARLDSPTLHDFEPDKKNLTVTDRWLLARTNIFLQDATDSMNDYSTPEVVQAFKSYIEDLSNWYVRLNRRRFWKSGDSRDKKAAYWCLYNALRVATQALAPVIPFMAEEIWQQAIRPFDPWAPVSIHLSDWPEPLPCHDDETLLEQTDLIRKTITLILRTRNQEQLRVRQPLANLYIVADQKKREAVERMSDIIAEEVNVKAIRFLEDRSELETTYLALDFKKAGPILKKDAWRIKDLLGNLDEAEMAALVQQFRTGHSVKLPAWPDPLPVNLFQERVRAKTGISIASEGEITIALHTLLSKSLVSEGLVRDLVRQVQVLRKD
ncbi:MAG: class I tRNA ligase family protein, partial [bacterium]